VRLPRRTQRVEHHLESVCDRDADDGGLSLTRFRQRRLHGHAVRAHECQKLARVHARVRRAALDAVLRAGTAAPRRRNSATIVTGIARHPHCRRCARCQRRRWSSVAGFGITCDACHLAFITTPLGSVPA
jgi:hypothetical protein